MATLAISESEIRSHGPRRILALCWKQWRTERRLAKRGIRFRSCAIPAVVAAYAAMTPDEFDAVNARQDWANWRTIPRALNSHVPDRPVVALDLGCGTGSSTQVLAFYLPTGSHIIGYEFAEPMLVFARRRTYRQATGAPAKVDFVCQSITECLRNADGTTIPNANVDLINASGVVGHHLTPETIQPLLQEMNRVLAPGGVAQLDVGPTISAPRLRDIMGNHGYACLGRYRSWVGDVTGQMVFRRSTS